MSGLIYGFSYSLAYTCAGTLSTRYGYDALRTGLVLLCTGVGGLSVWVYFMRFYISFWSQAACAGVLLGGDGQI